MPIKITAVPIAPPAPIIPRTKKIKLLDIDPIEIARQLTLMEFSMYKKIRPMECLLRSKESKPGKHKDSFSEIIQLSNRVHVVSSVLIRPLLTCVIDCELGGRIRPGQGGFQATCSDRQALHNGGRRELVYGQMCLVPDSLSLAVSSSTELLDHDSHCVRVGYAAHP